MHRNNRTIYLINYICMFRKIILSIECKYDILKIVFKLFNSLKFTYFNELLYLHFIISVFNRIKFLFSIFHVIVYSDKYLEFFYTYLNKKKARWPNFIVYQICVKIYYNKFKLYSEDFFSWNVTLGNKDIKQKLLPLYYISRKCA